MNFFSSLLTTLFERTSTLLPKGQQHSEDLPILCKELLSQKGEVKGLALAERILNQYRHFGDDEKLEFFNFLIDEMDFDIKAVKKHLNAYATNHKVADYRNFTRDAQPQRRQLFRRLNEAPGATFDLVSMRGDLLRLIPDNPQLSVIDVDLIELFVSWFNRGFLVLRPINWTSPAHILEKLTVYESVHEISTWIELRQRLAPPDRRCFAFFHPAMPEEPLIFVQVALTAKAPTSIQKILSNDRKITPAEKMDYAVFYSISNCQKGLAGISFGNSLIKTVVAELSRDFPQIKHFITLSPIPGFTRWLEQNDIEQESVADDHKDNIALAAYYLLEAKRKDGMPVDPVSRFHLGNGASVHALHQNADTSARGQKQSLSIMVNYLYERQKLVDNHEAFVGAGKINAPAKLQEMSNKIGVKLAAKH